MTELATWQCFKKVRAGQIRQIDAIYAHEGERPSSFRVHCNAAEEKAGVVIIEAPYGTFSRLITERGSTEDALGAYLVIDADGTITWEPSEAFESGHKLLGVPDADGRYIGLARADA